MTCLEGNATRELMDLAAGLAREAGAAALQGRRTGAGEVSTKSTPSDIVTEWDRRCEEIILSGLTLSRPQDAVIGEEGACRTGSSGIEWLVDPIDGTANFFFGLPAWAVSIGARDAAGPLAGAVYLPVLDEMFLAGRGCGATLNGVPIAPRATPRLGDAMLGTGFGYEPAHRTRHAGVVARMIGEVRDIRRMGAASVDMCFVACGRLDAYVEGGLGPWDIAAATVVALEAGCEVTDFSGGPVHPGQVVVAAPSVHAAVIDLCRRAEAGAE